MRLSPDSLYTGFESDWVVSLLTHWSWALDPLPTEVIGVTALGDVFYVRAKRIDFLHTSHCARGSKNVAANRTAFKAHQLSAQFARDYLCPQLVGDLSESHGPLRFGHCYSLLDRSRSRDDPDNYSVADLGLHLTLTGMMDCLEHRFPDDEPWYWRALANERRRMAQIIRETYPRIFQERRPQTANPV